jgi:hypothetical protein
VPAGTAIGQPPDGVEPSAGPFLIEYSRVAAVVSVVSLEEFGEEGLKANLEQQQWLEACARAHENVLEHALEMSAVLPARLATVYTDEKHVRRLLEREHDSLAAQLEELRDKREWGVKGFIDDDKLLGWLEGSDDELSRLRAGNEPTKAGAAYLARKKYDLLARERAGELKARCADTIHSALSAEADEAQRKATRTNALTRDADEIFLNGAYLVGRADEETFRATLRELAGRHESLGVRLDLTGPWPAYSFVTAVGKAE